jgi:hypothetical protein
VGEALGLLEELGDVHPLPLRFRETLANAAEQMLLERSAAWCHWRCFEIRNGAIRADLTVQPAAEARRTLPIPGAGVLRPMWDIGHRSPTGEPALMHEDRSVAGSAVILEIQRPTATSTK